VHALEGFEPTEGEEAQQDDSDDEDERARLRHEEKMRQKLQVCSPLFSV
jgi:hypothetical protein